MLPKRLYIEFNAADAVSRFHQAGEQTPRTTVGREELHRVLALQADKLFALRAYPSLDTVDPLSVSLTESNTLHELCLYNREGARHPQTNRPVETGHFTVSNSPPPSVTFHGDIRFWLDESKPSIADQ